MELRRNMSPGKQRGLRAVSDARGVIAALAIDQRTAMRSLFAQALGGEAKDVPANLLSEFKEAVSRTLTQYSSAILLDPEIGLPSAKQRASNAGLLLAYEQSGYDKNIPGRLPRLLDGWSALRLVEAGADAIKILLYYSSRSSSKTNEFKYAFIERVGAECVAADVPFFLELVSYVDGLDEKGPEFARVKAEVVTSGVAEFSKPRYRVDVLKVGFPVNLGFVEGSPTAQGAILQSRAEAKQALESAAAASGVPFIYLSEGVSNETFLYGLRLASEAATGFSGVLCGRATWKDGVRVFVKDGRDALEKWLDETGARNIQRVNECLKAATPLQFGERSGTSA
jgi:tagatose 1,6-diphosphate aldolase